MQRLVDGRAAQPEKRAELMNAAYRAASKAATAKQMAMDRGNWTELYKAQKDFDYYNGLYMALFLAGGVDENTGRISGGGGY